MSANAKVMNGLHANPASRRNPKPSMWHSQDYRKGRFNQIKRKPRNHPPAEMEGRLLKNAVECYAKIKEITYREAYERLSS